MNLGPLERAIMDVLWDAKESLLIREIQALLNQRAEKPWAYTTIQTVAERLVRKRLLFRTAERKAFRYGATKSREEHLTELMLTALAESPDRSPVLSRFAQSVDLDDALRLLDELARRAGRAPAEQPPGWVPPPSLD
uniref:BlaI/MecI/CopY family transcriptional regulator n=1 Tax=Herbidospora sakaeratensis TaxID=564415 RepID=UPI000785F1AE|nr:BlaI/MecI/CopY family transcriptional regulator [Herbidospora sakaeratensis]